MKREKTPYIVCEYTATSGGITAAVKLKDYLYRNYRDNLIRNADIDAMKEDLMKEKTRILAENPRAKDFPIEISSIGIEVLYVQFNGEYVMRLKKLNGIISF